MRLSKILRIKRPHEHGIARAQRGSDSAHCRAAAARAWRPRLKPAAAAQFGKSLIAFMRRDGLARTTLSSWRTTDGASIEGRWRVAAPRTCAMHFKLRR